MGLKAVMGATVVVLGFGTLGLGALIVNPRVFTNEGITMLLSCNFKQMFLIPSAQMTNEIGVSVGFYTPKSLMSSLLAKVMVNYKQETKANSFAALGVGIMALFTPVLESVVEALIDDTCVRREPSIERLLVVKQLCLLNLRTLLVLFDHGSIVGFVDSCCSSCGRDLFVVEGEGSAQVKGFLR